MCKRSRIHAFLGPIVMVANSLFITGANTGQETSEKKESRKESGKGAKGN
jgi:hypothetical protein